MQSESLNLQNTTSENEKPEGKKLIKEFFPYNGVNQSINF